ncbi:DNA adenine methylase [Bacillus safensis]|uniref:DNA adenine methylase n=1 Tax=Bacillus safensis TaxID=561879 RepID=UPI0022AA285F|nr:DNA adenine methylase [Bacillus safensis]MCZ2739289.1 DNA adenine methylase [Bacillus safensis]MEE3679498.1 DNA adenine methylase [Bacillus safensis]
MVNPSPLRYPGGKVKIYNFVKRIILQNNCKCYIEPFAGGAGVAFKLLLNKDVNRIIINDYDRSIFAFWHSVLYETEALIDLIWDTPINMENWHIQKEIQRNKEKSTLLELGFSTLFLNRTNRSGIIKAGVIGGQKQNGSYKMDCRFPKEKVAKKIETISKYRNKIRLSNMDALDFIDQEILKTKNSFTFFDPPYFLKGPSLYTNFYTEEDHIELSNKIQTTLRNRKWIVTYDSSRAIKDMYNKLSSIEFNLNYSAQLKRQGKEYMFFSKKILVPENINSLLKIVIE